MVQNSALVVVNVIEVRRDLQILCSVNQKMSSNFSSVQLCVTQTVVCVTQTVVCVTQTVVELSLSSGCPVYFSEKEELITTLATIKGQLISMQERERQAIEKVKVGIEVTEQANREKTEVRTRSQRVQCKDGMGSVVGWSWGGGRVWG